MGSSHKIALLPHLNSLQLAIVQGVWVGETYEDISAITRWSEPHVKAVGAALWELMSEILNERVGKKNFRSVMERRYKDLSALKSAQSSNGATSALQSLEFPDGPVKLTSTLYALQLSLIATKRSLNLDRCYVSAHPDKWVKLLY